MEIYYTPNFARHVLLLRQSSDKKVAEIVSDQNLGGGRGSVQERKREKDKKVIIILHALQYK